MYKMIVSITRSTTEVKGITNFAQLQEKNILKSCKAPKKIEKKILQTSSSLWFIPTAIYKSVSQEA
jgi:hypothetical protein